MTRNYKTDIIEENATIIDIYNEQIDYLTTKDLDFLEVFEEFIGDIEIKYDIKEYYDEVSTYDNIEGGDGVFYEVSNYETLIKQFNIDIFNVVFEINIDYYALDKKIIGVIFEELNIKTLEDFHSVIRYYELDSYRILSDKLLYNKDNNTIEATDLIKELLQEFKKGYAYQEILSEETTEEVTNKVSEYLTDQLQRKITAYNRYNVPTKIKSLYEYTDY